MLGILPFLIQWIALSQLGSQHFPHVQQPSMQLPKSHWTLLNEFKQLPEEEIDHFLPQICNMILDRESLREDDLYDYFESVVEQKCADCFSFGTRVCGVLKATQPAPSESLFKSLYTLTSPSAAQTLRSEERLRAFQERIEYATMYGLHLSPQHSEMRSTYYRDYQFMLDTLARLGIELKSYPVAQRNKHLRHALAQCNSLLYFRMASRGSISTSDTSLQDFASFHDLSAHNIATLLPEAAQYSLHLPLHKAGDKVCRILRFVESECEVLPSRERCPYVVVVEVLEQPYSTKSNMLYSHGRVPAVSLSHTVQSGNANGNGNGVNNGNMVHSQVLYNGQPQSQLLQQHSRDAEQVSQSATEQQVDGASSITTTTVADVYPYIERKEKKYSTPRFARGKLLSGKLINYRSNNLNNSGYKSMRRYRSTNSNNPINRNNNENSNFDRAEYETSDADPTDQAQQELSELEQAYDLYDEVSNYAAPVESTAEQIQSALNELGTVNDPSTETGLRTVREETESNDTEDLCLLNESHQFDLSKQAAQQRSLDSLRGGSVPPLSANNDNPADQKSLISSRVPIRRRPSARYRLKPGQHDQDKERLEPAVATGREEQGPRASSTPADVTSSTTTIASITSVASLRHSHSHSSSSSSFSSSSWLERRASLQASSPFGHLPGWDARSFIVKSGDDLRKEVLAMQVMEFCQKVFEMEGLDIFLRPYQILSTGAQAGLVEFLQGAESVDKIKKTLQQQAQHLLLQQQQQQSGFTSSPTNSAPTSATTSATSSVASLPTLKQYFELQFGESYSFFYAKAVKNFVKSLVGYSLLTYVVQVKDRHNANILFDEEGHVVHIDFGFILGDSPGFNINFESAPFKLTAEYIEILGGVQSEDFKQFQDLFLKGFLALQKHVDGIASIIQLFYGDKRKAAADGVRSRLLFPQSQADILSLIGDSLDNWRTKQYDWYQERTNNIQL